MDINPITESRTGTLETYLPEVETYLQEKAQQEQINNQLVTTRKILCYSDDLMMCEITFKKGSKGNFHKHEHLQITYIAKGSFEFTIGGETKIVKEAFLCYRIIILEFTII